MDPRNNGHHAPFTRPLSQPGARDARHAPIHPPPYTLQAPLRTSQSTLSHDPFLPRRTEQQDVRQEQHRPLSRSSFSLGKYAASLQREASGVAMENRERVQENGAGWRLGDERIDRYRSQSGEGKQTTLLYLDEHLFCEFGLFVSSLKFLTTPECAFSQWFLFNFIFKHTSIPCTELVRRTSPDCCFHSYLCVVADPKIFFIFFIEEHLAWSHRRLKAAIMVTLELAPCIIYLYCHGLYPMMPHSPISSL